MNMRIDSYGGSLENRTRFFLEIVKSVREKVANDYPVWCRIDGEQLNMEGTNEAIEIASMLQEAGADILDVSVCLNIIAVPPKTKPETDLMQFAREIRKTISIPLISGGGMNFEKASKLAAEGIVDMVTMGRPLLADPDLPEKLTTGIENEIEKCIDCRVCIDHIVKKCEPLKCAKNKAISNF